MLATLFFALKTRRYLHVHGIGEDARVRVAERAFRNGALTPRAALIVGAGAFELAGVGPRDVDAIDLQDTDSGSELIHIAENGFCEHASRRTRPPAAPSGSTAGRRCGAAPGRPISQAALREISRGGVHPARRRGRIKQM